MKVIPLSGVIGFDVSAKDIRAQLEAAAGDRIEVQISSPGGIIFAGLEIFNLIKNYRGPKSSRLMGMAASMASYIALAGDRVVAEDNVVFMVHGAQGVAIGDRLAMEKMASILSGFSGLLAKKYAEKSGKSEGEILGLMDAETWYFGAEAKDAGFVDEIVAATTTGATNKAAAIASARASVASAQARQAPWPADAMERAVAVLGGVPTRRPGQEDLMAQITAKGWSAEDVAFAVKCGVSLEDIALYGPRVDARENAARIAAHDQRRW
jgi:ATP-dependent protease ClpP protease subunit